MPNWRHILARSQLCVSNFRDHHCAVIVMLKFVSPIIGLSCHFCLMLSRLERKHNFRGFTEVFASVDSLKRNIVLLFCSCTSGVGLLVEYSDDNSDPDDIILSTEEAVSRLRIRSTPLEGLACSIIQQGDHVLAKRNHVNFFFDAEVIKAVRVRHSKKTHCRCTFTVKWIHNCLKGETAIVPSSALMRMSSESILVHPTIFAFFNTLSTSSCCDVSPLRTVAEGMDCEMDDNELEKQIEHIRDSADPSWMKITEEMLSEEVDAQEHSKFNPIAASEVCNFYIQPPSFQDCIMGSTRQAQCNLPIKTEVKHPPSPPFTQEVYPESRSPCNPIAACAALASLMSKLSDATDILSAHQDVKGHLCPPKINKNPVAMKLPNGSTSQNISLENNSSKTNDENHLRTEVATATLIPSYESIAMELFPPKKPDKVPQTVDASSEVWKRVSKNEKNSLEVASCVGKCVPSTPEKKIGLPTTAVERSSCEKVQTPFTNTRRLTRSMARETKEKQTVETENEEIQLTTSEQKLSVQERELLADKETLASMTDCNPSLTSSGEFKNQMDGRDIFENNVSHGTQDLSISRRLTRSAINGRTKKNTEERHNQLEDLTKSDVEICPVHDICPNPNAEGYNKVQSSASTETAHIPEGGATSSVTRSQGIKRKSITSKKQELRFSPRLRFLPRTRSQTRS